MSEEIKRELDEHGIPKPFSVDEKSQALKEYIHADAKEKIVILGKYPFLAGMDWQKYQPKAS